jgi:hypothetical protein
MGWGCHICDAIQELTSQFLDGQGAVFTRSGD